MAATTHENIAHDTRLSSIMKSAEGFSGVVSHLTAAVLVAGSLAGAAIVGLPPLIAGAIGASIAFVTGSFAQDRARNNPNVSTAERIIHGATVFLGGLILDYARLIAVAGSIVLAPWAFPAAVALVGVVGSALQFGLTTRAAPAAPAHAAA